MPVAVVALAVVAAARNAQRAALLLAGADTIGECGRNADVIQLRRGLIEPGAPCPAPVQCHEGALVADQGEDVGICWVDPDVLVVVAAWCAPQRNPGLSAVDRLHGRESGAVHDVGIGRIDSYDRQITSADA